MCLSPFFCNGSSLENMFVSKQYQRSFYITFYLVISFMPLTGKVYTRENGYTIDQMGMLALYNLISTSQKEDQPMNIGAVKDMIDNAIMKSKGSPRPLYIRYSLNPKSRYVELLSL